MLLQPWTLYAVELWDLAGVTVHSNKLEHPSPQAPKGRLTGFQAPIVLTPCANLLDFTVGGVWDERKTDMQAGMRIAFKQAAAILSQAGLFGWVEVLPAQRHTL